MATLTTPKEAAPASAPTAKAARTRLLLEGAIIPTLLKLSAPNVLNLIAISVIVTAGAFFVGWLGASGPSRYTAFGWLTQIGVDPSKTKMVITEGAADSLTKLAGGHVLLAIHSVAEAHALTTAGKIRLLAVLSPSRVKYIPDVPTAEEQGVMKGVRVQWWASAAFPPATPDSIVKKWESAVAEMAKDPTFVAGADRINMNIDFLNAADMRAFVEKEVEGYTDMAGKIGIRR